ncbi:MBL fold metallo-hydrolase [Frankia sp. CNm7]|uniref:MBL fold metallo-hydrolase n=1 Tax=Frankia nepalensis TaxID=1836974 RepID=A0A937UW22_9ACTN|nr:MBL fold metallo-hydrolase [Frankia nepalensis]MBL7498884.1 MBL fold metallo-hydrolase [Frankia nepalensis]MBL7512559.1 MBL fold metallo-hydrolase [Frankia nepalensis]MBL7524247.1 MBL fold metallo-hydrolase [Frankia nepalensis]MBL7632926.1 MBL fold metallo-hydrolase [Frankia nepalensis]
MCGPTHRAPGKGDELVAAPDGGPPAAPPDDEPAGGRIRVDHLVTSGVFTLDGGRWNVDNNVWLIGDDEECVLLDAPHNAAAIVAAVGDRRLRAILCTHAHDDHVDAALAVAAATGARIWLHPADRELWDRTHPNRAPDHELAAGAEFTIGAGDDAVSLTALHTPGHTWGSVSFYAPALSTVFTGDTLFQGGPGATGRSFSDFPTIIDSITGQLLGLPPETVVRTGHGGSTTIGREAPARQSWIDRGH